MTLEEKLEKLADSLTVEAELLARHERQANTRFEQHEAWLGQLDERLDAMSTIAQSHQKALDDLLGVARDHHDQLLEFRTAAARLFDLLDKFIRGQQGNGHGAL